MLNLQKIQLKGGKIFYNNYAIDPALPFEAQELEFNQNLLSLDYFGKYRVALDWLPALNPKGRFILCVIEKDWDNPLYIKKFKRISFIEENLQKAINFVSTLTKKDKEGFLNKIDLKGLKIIKDDITFYQDDSATTQSEYHMKIISEDLQYIIDVAWLPFETTRGLFTVRVIMNYLNQPQLIFHNKTQNINSLHKKVQEAIDFVLGRQKMLAKHRAGEAVE